MSLVTKAESFLRSVAVKRGDAVSTLKAEALADLIVAYEERMAIVLEAGDIAEAEAHRIATAECGASIAELCARLSAITPDHNALTCASNLTMRPT